MKRSFVGLVPDHPRLLQQKGLNAGATSDALLLIKMKTQQLSKSAAVVVSGGFGISKSLKHEPVAHNSIGQIQRVGLSIHVHHKLCYFFGSFCLAGSALAADDDAFAHSDAV